MYVVVAVGNNSMQLSQYYYEFSETLSDVEFYRMESHV